MKRLVAVLAVLALAACGGGGTAPRSGTDGPTESGTLSLTIPAATTSAAARRRGPAFVSPDATTASVAVNGGTATSYNVGSTSPSCTTTGGIRSCAIGLTVPVGSDTIAVSLSAGSTLLGQGSNSVTVVAGTPFTVTVGINPVVAEIAGASFAFSSGSSFLVGTAAQATISLTFSDPEGATITGSGNVPNFLSPVVLTSTSSHVTISPTSLVTPGQTFTLTYDGSTGITFPVTLSATVGGNLLGASFVPFSAALNEPQGLAWDTVHGTLYVANTGGNQILEYPGQVLFATVAHTNVVVANGAPLAEPIRIAFDPSSLATSPNLWIADPATSPNGNLAELNVTSGAFLQTITAGVNGPLGVAVDNNGYVYLANTNGGMNSLTTFAPPAYTSTQTFTTYAAGGCGSGGTFATVGALAFDANANLIEASASSSVVGISAAAYQAGSPACSYLATQSIGTPTGIAFNPTAQTLYVANAATDTITGYTLTAPGAPALTIALPAAPGGLTADTGGNIYVALPSLNQIRVYTSSGSFSYAIP